MRQNPKQRGLQLKYQQVYAALRREIDAGRLGPGDRLPSEAELVRRFGASRITVGRAVRELQTEGLVHRRAGSGSYVSSTGRGASGHSFGLLIPDLGDTEVFEPMCQGMMTSPLARDHALIWGSLPTGLGSRAERAWQLCRQYIDRRVSGVFFAPVEFASGKDAINRRIVDALEAARIPAVLLDRAVLPYPARGDHDLVALDNRRAGFVMTAHLLDLGVRRVGFLAYPHAAASVDAREAGYREALHARDVAVDGRLSFRLDPEDRSVLGALLGAGAPEALVCANDRTAARLMHGLLRLGCRIPDDLRLVGIDDVEYAGLLPVPLTTLRQPTRAIGDAALATMLQRVARPELPPREVLLHGDLIVRESCGAQLSRRVAS